MAHQHCHLRLKVGKGDFDDDHPHDDHPHDDPDDQPEGQVAVDPEHVH